MGKGNQAVIYVPDSLLEEKTRNEGEKGTVHIIVRILIMGVVNRIIFFRLVSDVAWIVHSFFHREVYAVAVFMDQAVLVV